MSEIETKRLILRPFVKNDVTALFRIMSDAAVNRFLPLFPLKTIEEAENYLQEKYLNRYEAGVDFYYALCFKADNVRSAISKSVKTTVMIWDMGCAGNIGTKE